LLPTLYTMTVENDVLSRL